MPVTAQNLLQLLRSKHSKDVFISECKNGPTHYVSHRRLDAWAMKKSWRHPSYIGYEIKVARNDFLRDDKWMEYLPLCSSFYFVSPSKVIKPEEVPEQAGLLWSSTNGTRLYTKKKAPYREIAPPEDLMLYVLMQYAPTGGDANNVFWERRYYGEGADKRRYWKDWLEEKKLDYELGYKVSKGIRKRIDEEINKVQRENANLREENNELKRLKEAASAAGISLYQYTDYGEKLKEIVSTVNYIKRNGAMKELRRVHELIGKTLEAVTVEEKGGDDDQQETTP